MRKIFLPLMLLLIAFVFAGCAAPSMYYWGDYSKTLYKYRKDPSEKTALKHKEMLDKIIEESRSRDLRIPPGVCAELGYLYLSQGNTNEAIRYFELEKKTYPESSVLVERLVQSAKAREGKSANLETEDSR